MTTTRPRTALCRPRVKFYAVGASYPKDWHWSISRTGACVLRSGPDGQVGLFVKWANEYVVDDDGKRVVLSP